MTSRKPSGDTLILLLLLLLRWALLLKEGLRRTRGRREQSSPTESLALTAPSWRPNSLRLRARVTTARCSRVAGRTFALPDEILLLGNASLSSAERP